MSLPVRLHKKPRHIFKCTSVEQYSSLLGIHKESILVWLSTSSWIMHLGLALSALFCGSNDLSSSEQLCPRTAPSWVIFLWRSADHTSCSCAKPSSCGVSVHLPNTSNETNLLAARCHGGRCVLLWYENCQSVEISFIKFCFFGFFCTWGGGDGQNNVSVTLITPVSLHIYFYFIYRLHVGWFKMELRLMYVVLLSADAEAASQTVMTDHSIH